MLSQIKLQEAPCRTAPLGELPFQIWERALQDCIPLEKLPLEGCGKAAARAILQKLSRQAASNLSLAKTLLLGSETHCLSCLAV